MPYPYKHVILLFFLLDANIWLIIKTCAGGHLWASALNDLVLGNVRTFTIGSNFTISNNIIVILILKHDHLIWIMYIYYICIIV